MRTPGILSCALALVVAAHAAEIAREERFGFRITGDLPAGWSRDAHGLAWTFRFEGIPHAHVAYGCQPVESAPDPLDALQARANYYRFPSMPDDTEPSFERTTWAGLPAARVTLTAMIGGVACVRRATAAVHGTVFIECIETVYGEATESLAGCREGLDALREGFEPLLTDVPPEERDDPAPRTYEDARFGYRLFKPEGLVRQPVDPALDPGCRYSFRRPGPHDTWLLVRFFEYGVRETFAPEKWCAEFFRAFSTANERAQREADPDPPSIVGARTVHAERFTGTRDGRPVTERVIVVHSRRGVACALRLRVTGEAGNLFDPTIAEIVTGLNLAAD